LIDGETLVTNVVNDDDEVEVVDVTFVVGTATVVVKLVLDEEEIAEIDEVITEDVHDVEEEED